MDGYPEETKVNIFVSTFLTFFMPLSSELVEEDLPEEHIKVIYGNVDYEEL